MASQEGQRDRRELLAHPDIDVNKALTSDGRTALIFASQEGHTEIVEKLMARPDIDVNKADTSKRCTALMMASRKGHIEIVEKLLARPDIDINQARTSDGCTAIIWASQVGHTEIVKRLVWAGATSERLPYPLAEVTRFAVGVFSDHVALVEFNVCCFRRWAHLVTPTSFRCVCIRPHSPPN